MAKDVIAETNAISLGVNSDPDTLRGLGFGLTNYSRSIPQ